MPTETKRRPTIVKKIKVLMFNPVY